MANLPQDPIEYAAWEAKMLDSIDSLKNSDPETAIAKLGRLVGQLSESPNKERGDRTVYNLAKLTLVTIPGHAEYYANRINKVREEVDGVIQSGGKYPPLSDLLNEQMYGFQTLSQLPSPETVRVLGEFLTDERGRMIIPPESKGREMKLYDLWQQDPNSTLAAETLSRLPLKTKPHAVIDEWDKDSLTPWIHWYAQIKVGRRTFSFEGDPQEYDLTGPVSGTRNPDTPRERRRPTDPKSAKATATPKSPSSTPWIAGAIVVLIGAGGWFYLKKQQSP